MCNGVVARRAREREQNTLCKFFSSMDFLQPQPWSAACRGSNNSYDDMRCVERERRKCFKEKTSINFFSRVSYLLPRRTQQVCVFMLLANEQLICPVVEYTVYWFYFSFLFSNIWSLEVVFLPSHALWLRDDDYLINFYFCLELWQFDFNKFVILFS